MILKTLSTCMMSRVGALLLSVPGGGAAEAPEGVSGGACSSEGQVEAEALRLWESVLSSATSALALAYQHAGGCSCDIGDALRAMAIARASGALRPTLSGAGGSS